MTYSNILLPVDFSETNKNSLEKAKLFKDAQGGKITLAHIIDYIPPVYMQADIPELYMSQELMVERATAHLEDLRKKSGLEQCDVIVRVGNPKNVLPELQQEFNHDLLIMAKHSHKGIARILGSTTNSVLNKIQCDVLVIPE